MWIDPNTGAAKDPTEISGKTTTIPKPDDKEWLLLLIAAAPSH